MASTDALLEQIGETLIQGRDIATGWLSSPSAWAQFTLIAVSLALAHVIAKRLAPRLSNLVAPGDGTVGVLAVLRRLALRLIPLLRPLMAWAIAGGGELALTSVFGTATVIAFGKRVFLLLAARAVARDVLTDPFLRLLGRYVLVPVAVLYALGLLPAASAWLSGIEVSLGNIRFSAMALIRGIVSGSLLFWLGAWSNRQSSSYIKSQEELRPATRELAVKAVEILIFGAAFLLLLNIMGIDLTAIAVLGGALGVGVGLGLQQIAANFVSGIILLIEGQTTVGDFVELDGGERGTIVRMTARSCVLETFDGRWIVVPNEHFITTRVINYSDQGSANRYEAAFSVSYDTDINRVPALIEAAVGRLGFVLRQPSAPECDLAGFGESGVDFVVKYWVQGIDDGRNRYGADVLFAVWNALKAEGIEIPYPHRVVELRGGMAPA